MPGPVFDLSQSASIRGMTPRLLLWESFVAVAILGYGLAVLRLFRQQRQPTGIALCAGIASWLFIGGWLNLVGIATRAVLLALLLVGVLLFAGAAARPQMRLRWRTSLRSLVPSTPILRVAAAILAVWFLLCLGVHVASFAFNRFDDLQAYMPFADKASALGGLQPEPFSERRITSGVGGAIFLDATMLAASGNTGIDFLEGGLGYIAVLLCLGALTRVFRLAEGFTLAVFYAAGFFTLGRANLSVVNLSAALFLAVLLLLMDSRTEGRDSSQSAGRTLRDAVLVGILLGGAFALKSSNIPFCAIFLILPALVYTVRRRSLEPVAGLLVVGVASVLFLAPWAIKHRIDEGTLLFPSLGRGYHLTAYGFPPISETVSKTTSLLASLYDLVPPLIAGLFSWALLGRIPGLPRAPVLSFFVATTVAAPLFAVAIAAEDLDRFFLPMDDLCALLFLCILFAAIQSATSGPWIWPPAVFFLLWMAGFGYLASIESFFRDFGDAFLIAGRQHRLQWYEMVVSPADSEAHIEEVRRAQDTVPAHAVLLESIEHAYGFDWQRNPVLIADYPGMASLPPGLPLDGSPEQLRQYLLDQGIHYVMFDRTLNLPSDYFDFRQHPQRFISMKDILENRKVQGYTRMEYFVSNRSRSMFEELSRHHPRLYDDGELVVVSLDGSMAE